MRVQFFTVEKLLHSETKHFDWMLLVTWRVWTNQRALFHKSFPVSLITFVRLIFDLFNGPSTTSFCSCLFFSNILQNKTENFSRIQTQIVWLEGKNDKHLTNTSDLFFIIFVFSEQTLQFIQQICVKKCPSSIRRWDLNPRPSGHKSPPITTRPRCVMLYHQ